MSANLNDGDENRGNDSDFDDAINAAMLLSQQVSEESSNA